MRISADTRSALAFMVGLFGILEQAAMPLIHVEVSWALCLTFLTMMGISIGPGLIAQALGGVTTADGNERPKPPKDEPHEK